MIKLRIISFFLVLVMSVQMLPLLQIGCALSSNQWTEELPHNCERSSKGNVSFNNTFLPPDQHMLVSNFCDASTFIFLHISEHIPSNHSVDVVSPPPDAQLFNEVQL